MFSNNMTDEIKIARWKAEGFRCPDHEISFVDENDVASPITLIQMPNGTGKTTTLELLRAALSGSAADGLWDKDKIHSFAKRGNKGKGLFELVLLHNNRRLTIVMLFDFEEGTVRYTTTSNSGKKEGFHPSIGLAKFLHPEFVPFFVFDGELAERLLSREFTNAQEAIEDLFQLKVFTHLTTRVQDFWQEQTRFRGATEERGLSRRRNRLELLKNRIAQLRGMQEKAKGEYHEAEQELHKKKNKFNAAIARHRDFSERLIAAETNWNEVRSEVQASAKEVLGQMRGPHALSSVFASEMITLKASLDRAKLPESTAREFFEELSLEPQCICGRELDEDTRQAIRARAKHYLGSDDVALLNAIKGDIAGLIGVNPVENEANLVGKIDNLKQLLRHEGELQTTRDQIKTEGISQDPELENVQKEIADLESKLKLLEIECDRFEDMSEQAGDDDTFGIKILERRFEDAKNKLAEITQTLELKEKSDAIVRVLNLAQVKARNGISREICVEANQRIHDLMPDNAIRIEKVDRCLILQGQEGGSVGETLSVAYAFLATLFNRTEHQLPFIVDSPANPIDLHVRKKVAELIPKLTSQFIAFTISSEREGFLTPLEAAMKGKSIQYLTLFRKGPKELEDLAKGEPQKWESVDGLRITGRDFFRKFHVDQEVNHAAI
jgi:DNA sulfur modification protein DndD